MLYLAMYNQFINPCHCVFFRSVHYIPLLTFNLPPVCESSYVMESHIYKFRYYSTLSFTTHQFCRRCTTCLPGTHNDYHYKHNHCVETYQKLHLFMDLTGSGIDTSLYFILLQGSIRECHFSIHTISVYGMYGPSCLRGYFTNDERHF